MAYNGRWYLKVGDYPIPPEYMAYKSYTAAPDQTLDLDSYTDADGITRRNILPHTASKYEFETVYLTNKQFRTLIDNIRANFTDVVGKECVLTYYDEWTDSYKTGNFYMPGTMEFTHYNKFIYEPFRIAFIEH